MSNELKDKNVDAVDDIFHSDAQKYTALQTQRLFVPNRVWDQVRDPTRNRLLYGVPGSGKTIALKRLSWPAMVSDPVFLPGRKFVAFYCDLRDLARITTTLDSPIFRQDDPDRTNTARIFEFGSSLHLLIEMAADLIEASEGAEANPEFRSLQEVLVSSVLEFCDRSFGLHDLGSLGELWQQLLDLKNDFFDALYDAQSLDEILEACYVPMRPLQFAHSIHLQFQKRRSNVRLAWLLDQFETLPFFYQRPLNSLLTREASSFCFTVGASTPYSFNPHSTEGPLKTVADFELTSCEYFVGEEEEYLHLLNYAWERLGTDGQPLHSVLLGGPRYLASMSARSVRRFLEFCRNCNAHRAGVSTMISKETQRDVVQGAATAVQEDLHTGGDIPQGALWGLATTTLVQNRSELKTLLWPAPAGGR